MFEFLSGSSAVSFVESSGIPVVRHFGDPERESAAAASTAVAIPFAELIRIRVTGRDRSKFLHSFCTNNVRDLAEGSACEALFTDARARVVAHGWILAASDQHEIWMLAHSADTLVKHLSRYIISEDVTLTSQQNPTATIAVVGPRATEMIECAFGVPSVPRDSGRWSSLSPGFSNQISLNNDSLVMLHLTLAGVSVVLCANRMLTGEATCIPSAWQRLNESGCTPAGVLPFERLRVLDRIPRIGIDMTTDHIAPEADRNTTTISYTKGCYLGQEPIARLDALGHINRALRAAVRIQTTQPIDSLNGAVVQLAGTGDIGKLTSVCFDVVSGVMLGLAMIRVHGVNLSTGVTVRTADGNSFPAEVFPLGR